MFDKVYFIANTLLTRLICFIFVENFITIGFR